MKFITILTICCSLVGLESSGVLSNRPLAQVGGTPITLLDVVHKMNLQLVQSDPQILDNPTMLQSYYNQYWKVALEGCVEDELLFLEGEEKKLVVKEHQVQESLQQMIPEPFFKNLEKVKLTMDQAKVLAKKQFFRRQLEGYFLYSSALLKLTPHRIKSAYITHLKENPPEDVWQYRIVNATNTPSTPELKKKVSKELVTSVNLSLSDFPIHPNWKTFSLVSKIEAMFPPNLAYTVSKPFQVPTSQLSHKYKKALSKIASGEVTPFIRKKIDVS